MKDLEFMKEAYNLAKIGMEKGEVPVGAVIVLNDEIIGYGYNTKESDKLPTSHAEINAIKSACEKIGDWRLNNAIMYVTSEPCVMCAGAIIHGRISHVHFGVREPKFGGVISCNNIFSNDDNSHFNKLNHKVTYSEGLMKDEISALMKEFFRDLRNKK